MSSRARDQKILRGLIESDQLAVVIGSGVSKAVCPEAPMWRDLIASGLAVCERVCQADKAWCEQVRSMMALESHPDMLLFAAESVEKELKKHDEKRFRDWLKDKFAALKPTCPEIIETIASGNVPILTTNYDGLIEAVTRYGHVTWRDDYGSVEVVRGPDQDRRVLHLHGFWLG